MNDEVVETEASEQVIRMGWAIADRMVAQKKFPWPKGMLAVVAKQIEAAVVAALPHKPADVLRALCSLAYAGFLERTITLSRLQTDPAR